MLYFVLFNGVTCVYLYVSINYLLIVFYNKIFTYVLVAKYLHILWEGWKQGTRNGARNGDGRGWKQKIKNKG